MRDGLRQLLRLFAGGADLRQRRQVLLGLGEIADHQKGLADVLVGAKVLGVEVERPPVVREGVIEPAEIAIAVGEQVEDVRVARIGLRRSREKARGAFPVAGLDCLLAALDIALVRLGRCIA